MSLQEMCCFGNLAQGVRILRVPEPGLKPMGLVIEKRDMPKQQAWC